MPYCCASSIHRSDIVVLTVPRCFGMVSERLDNNITMAEMIAEMTQWVPALRTDPVHCLERRNVQVSSPLRQLHGDSDGG